MANRTSSGSSAFRSLRFALSACFPHRGTVAAQAQIAGTMPDISNVAVDEASSSRALMLELDLRRGRMRHGLQQALRTAIQEGRLTAGTRLPSSRSLAAELGVSRGVVVDTYDQLAAECYLDVRPRQAPVVATLASPDRDRAIPSVAAAIPAAPAAEVLHDFIATTPDVELFPRRAWVRAVERAVANATNETLDYSDHRGRIELRTELAAYLGRVRGLRITPDRIVVTQGFTQALDLLCRVLHGAERADLVRVAVTRRRVGHARAAGLEIGAVPVDAAGIRTDLLPLATGLRRRGHACAPVSDRGGDGTGAAARAGRLGTAHRGLIVEDDYDAEFRYDRAAIGALQGLDPEHVVHVGTASKTLAPGVRLGWMSLPAALVAGPSRRKGIGRLRFARDRPAGARRDVQARGLRTTGRERAEPCIASVAMRSWSARTAAPGSASRRGRGRARVLLRLDGVDDVALVQGRGVSRHPPSPAVPARPRRTAATWAAARLRTVGSRVDRRGRRAPRGAHPGAPRAMPARSQLGQPGIDDRDPGHDEAPSRR